MNLHADPAVRLRGLSRTYGHGAATVAALDGVDLTIDAGVLTAVMGPSGSGKSTLLHCAAGLDRPTAGQVLLHTNAGSTGAETTGAETTGAGVVGEGVVDLARLDETALTVLRRRRIGFVFQSFNLVESLSAADNVALPLRFAGLRPRPSEVASALDAVGLSGRERHRPSELSGGEQQRVALARALITRPAVVFADEPTGALDTRSSRQVLDLLRDLVDRHGHTVITVTHDPIVASRADRVIFLADGRVAGELPHGGTPETIAARMTHLEEPCAAS